MDFDDFLSQIAGDLKPEDPTLDEKLLGQAVSSLSGESDKKVDWHPFAGPQTMAKDSKADEIFFGGAAGGGKGGPLDSLVCTPSGFKELREITIGSKICNPDGTTATVIEEYFLGEKDLYEIEFVDGAKTKVTSDHLWHYWGDKKNSKQQHKYVVLHADGTTGIHYVDGFLGTTDYLMKYTEVQKTKRSLGEKSNWANIPLTAPVNFEENLSSEETIHWIHPYLLGVLLGDGCITSKTVSLSGIDDFIFDEAARKGNISYGKKQSQQRSIIKNRALVDNLSFWNLLGTKSATKFIPQKYLFSSVENRFELAKGIFDTDGYIDKRGHLIYNTVSEQLANDVRQLCMSLGAKVTIFKKQGSYKSPKTGEKIECQLAYHLYIRAEDNSLFVSLPRKKNRCKKINGEVKRVGRRIVDIRPAGKSEAKCIRVDNPNGLYITNDFIVTHNTYLILGLALTEHKRSIIFRREYKQLSEIVEKSRELLQPFPEATYNGTDYRWRGIPGGRILEFGSIPTDQSVTRYQGRAHDLKAFDEISNFCLHEDAEVYTRRGWIKLKDATTDDEVISCNKYMNISWEKIEKVLEFPYDGNLMHIKTKLLDFMCTPNHKLVTWVRNNLFVLKEAQDFSQEEQLPIPIGIPLPAEKDSELETQYNVWRLEKLQKVDIAQVPYKGKVYCLQVPPHRTFLARQNEKMFWSGNSSNQYRFLIGWARTDDPHQRVRILSAGNPPTNAEGEWVLQRWGAWLDPQHSNPAVPGELRWFVVIDGDDVEVEDNKPVKHKDEIIVPRSRTFIPSRVEDNPVYMASGYKSVLQALPEPLRSQMLYGSFNLNMSDDPNGVIPMSWIRESQNRWKALHKEGVVDKMRNASVSFGLDVASGGGDRTALCKLTGTIVQWIHVMRITGDEDLFKQADWVLMQLEGHKAAPIGVDAIGVGAGLYHRLRNLALKVAAIKGSQGTDIKDRTGHLTFLNLRAAMWWMMRDALDPDGKTLLALPPDDRELAAELAAPKWNTTAIGRIQIEAKESVRDRLGRSPDKAEALLMAYYVNTQRRPPMRMI